jgi:hypothetical protein
MDSSSMPLLIEDFSYPTQRADATSRQEQIGEDQRPELLGGEAGDGDVGRVAENVLRVLHAADGFVVFGATDAGQDRDRAR